MAERRSMGDAFARLPDDKLSFIEEGPVSSRGARSSKRAVDLVEPGEASEDTKSERRVVQRTRVRQTAKVEIPDSWKVPVTIKLQYRTAQALRRAYLEQKLNHATPNTQQEIVEHAVQMWLRGNGYLQAGESD